MDAQRELWGRIQRNAEKRVQADSEKRVRIDPKKHVQIDPRTGDPHFVKKYAIVADSEQRPSSSAPLEPPVRYSGLEHSKKSRAFAGECGETHIGGPEAQMDEIVEEAKNIYREVLDSAVPADADDENEVLYNCLRTHHKNFATSFPIILRWAVQKREFSEIGFRKFLRRYQAAVGKTGGMWPTREAFLENQADYLVILYKTQNTRWNTTFIKEYRKSIVHQLLKEQKDYTESSKEAEEEVKRIDKIADQKRRETLYAFLIREQARAAEKADEVPPGGAPSDKKASSDKAPSDKKASSDKKAPSDKKISSDKAPSDKKISSDKASSGKASSDKAPSDGSAKTT